jgi:hypothetical protein
MKKSTTILKLMFLLLLWSCKTVKVSTSDNTPPTITEWSVLNSTTGETTSFKGSDNKITVHLKDELVILCWAEDPQGVKSVDVLGSGAFKCEGFKDGNIYSSNTIVPENSKPNVTSPDENGNVPTRLSNNVLVNVKNHHCLSPITPNIGSGSIKFSGIETSFSNVISGKSTFQVIFK